MIVIHDPRQQGSISISIITPSVSDIGEAGVRVTMNHSQSKEGYYMDIPSNIILELATKIRNKIPITVNRTCQLSGEL